MKKIATAYVTTLVAFLAVNSIWLSRMGEMLYRPVMGDMLLDGFRAAPALAFYLIYIGGLIRFAVLPAVAAGAWTRALVDGATFGLVAYATYDLTNQATLKNWSTLLTLADLGWGTFLSALAATLGAFATARILGAR